jgi:hypothetical protein
MTLSFNQQEDKLIIDEVKSFKQDKLHSKTYIMKMELNLRTLEEIEQITKFNHVRLTM